jgi:ketosteroid isomerase-like protein
MCLNLEAGAQPHQAVDNDAVRWQQAARDHAHSVVFKRADLDLIGNGSAIVLHDHQCLAGLVGQLAAGSAHPEDLRLCRRRRGEIGRKTGRQAVADFIRDIRALTEPVTFEVEDILASESRAAIIGALQTRIKATGKITATQFAIILTISGDVVTRFQMLEDSFDVSKAARS